MMTVLEYANDVDKSVAEIIDLCGKLGIKANQEDAMLSDDDIILLDNEIANDSELEDDNDENVDSFDNETFEDSYEDELEEVEVVATVKKKRKS